MAPVPHRAYGEYRGWGRADLPRRGERGLHLVAIGAATSAAVLALAAPAAATCGETGYAYAGLEAAAPAAGVAATVTALSQPRVRGGHVAAWVGVGGYGLGPGGANEWLQAGVATLPGRASRLYVEWKTPHRRAHVLRLQGRAGTGVSHRVAVVAQPGRSGAWRAYVDGVAVGPVVALPGSQSHFEPMAVTESWDGGTGACNRFAYRFRDVSVADRAGAWAPLAAAYRVQDPGQRLIARTLADFTARSR